MTVTSTARLVAEALAEARSSRPVGPDTSAGPARQSWAGEPTDLAAERGALDLGRLLAISLKAGPADRTAEPVDPGDGVSTRRRPVASAGGLHPVNAHLLVGPGCSVPPGRYAYDPLEHRAFRRGPAPANAPCGVIAVLTVNVQRTASHYGHRSWPLLLLDTGHAVAALAMAAIAHGHHSRLTLNVDAARLAAAAGLPVPDRWTATWAATRPEPALAAVYITVRTPADQFGRFSPCPLTTWAIEPLATPPATGPAPSLAGHRAGAVLDALSRTTAPTVWWPAKSPFSGDKSSLAEAIANRRSAPPPLRGQPDPGALAAVLSAASDAGPYGPAWCAAVGMPPGLVTADPSEPKALRSIASGEARPTLAVWAARQGWLSQAGAVLLAEGVPNSASAERIRVEHLAAGYAAARAELTATALGLRTRPIGSWQAADLGAALGGPAGQRWVIHGLALASPLRSSPPSHSRSDRP
jgi:nitroreductase